MRRAAYLAAFSSSVKRASSARSGALRTVPCWPQLSLLKLSELMPIKPGDILPSDFSGTDNLPAAVQEAT